MDRMLPLAALLLPLTNFGDTKPDPRILAAIQSIRAIDNHAHPVRAFRPSIKPDDEYDALPTDAMQPFDLPTRLRPTNPQYIEAWRELFGYPYHDASPAHLKVLMARKHKVAVQKGANYGTWVLGRLGIETMISNRVVMGYSLPSPRFRWVPFDDALLFPLNNAAAKRKNPEYRSMYGGEERLFQRYLRDLGLKQLPDTLDGYLERVVTATLVRQRQRGALAVKFEAAYLRGLDFAMAPKSEADQVYAQYVRGGEPEPKGYKALQDYIFHALAKRAGRLGLAVHFHTGAGVGAYFDLAGADPLKLEPVFDDPELRGTKFVLLHGGWPFQNSTAFLLSKPNVYADYSYQTFVFTPQQIAATLKTWLTLVPEKVLFATDSAAITDEVNWEEVGWLSNRTARRALAIALTELVQEGNCTRPEALRLARLVLHDNAAKLYGL